jgi:hypothetical protein
MLPISNSKASTADSSVAVKEFNDETSDSIADISVSASETLTSSAPSALTADVADVSSTEADASMENHALDASIVLNSPKENYYVGYLTGDGVPPNGAPYGFGITFPGDPATGQFYLRTDYLPNRLFRYDGRHWIKFEDNVRMTIRQTGETQTTDPTKVRKTQKATFINNNNTATIAGEVVQERQALSKALKPRADN